MDYFGVYKLKNKVCTTTKTKYIIKPIKSYYEEINNRGLLVHHGPLYNWFIVKIKV